MKTFLTRFLASIIFLAIYPFIVIGFLILGLIAIWRGKKPDVKAPNPAFTGKPFTPGVKSKADGSTVTLDCNTPFIFKPDKWGNS